MNVKPLVSIIMDNISDFPVMEKVYEFPSDLKISFEVSALSVHRTPAAVEEFTKETANRGIKMIIAAAGTVAALPGVIAINTTLPIAGVPIEGMLDGLGTMLNIIQVPPDIPVATVGANTSMNVAILVVETLALTDGPIAQEIRDYKVRLGARIMKVNADLTQIKDYEYKTS